MSFAFDTTVYFGASHSDNGNLYALTEEVLSTPIPGDDVGYQQAATNGDVFVEYASDLLGASSSLNYAVAGARALGSRSLGELIADRSLTDTLIVPTDDPRLDFDISLTAQIARYLADTDGTDRSTTSVSLMIGLNDLNQFEATETEIDLILNEFARLNEDVLAATLDAAHTLLDAGVGQVVLNTLPSTGFLALAGDEDDDPLAAVRSAARDEYNDRLRAEAAALAEDGAPVVVVDMEALTIAVQTDPTAFGFVAPWSEPMMLTTVFDPTPNPAVDGYDPDQIAFFDERHPSTDLHGVMGAFSAASLTSTVYLAEDMGAPLATTAEADLVLSGDLNDDIFTRAGDDVALAGLGDDRVIGGWGDDIVSGGSGNDTVRGWAGADVVDGAAGDDLVSGGRGNDVLIGGLGNDTLMGCTGDDQFLFAEAELIGGTAGDLDEIHGGRGYDTLYLALTDASRAKAETALADNTTDPLAFLGLTVMGVEEIVFVDTRTALADIETDARLSEADLWGLI